MVLERRRQWKKGGGGGDGRRAVRWSVVAVVDV
jgi:hypothetical protein